MKGWTIPVGQKPWASLKRLRIKNFKTFRSLDLSLDRLNVLIGANASGKSNLVQVFKFLSDISEQGLENAISLQGGVEFLRNLNIGAREPTEISLAMEPPTYRLRDPGRKLALSVREFKYDFQIRYKGRQRSGLGFAVGKQTIEADLEISRAASPTDTVKPYQGVVSVSLDDGKYDFDLRLPSELESVRDKLLDLLFWSPSTAAKLPVREGRLLIDYRSDVPLSFLLAFEPPLKGIGVYDFEPKLLKSATPIAGKADLEPDANNLPIVLNEILRDREGRRRMQNLLRDLLPFISDLKVSLFADRTLLVMMKEVYSGLPIPASFLADGTLSILALLTAVYFSRKWLVVIEEPDRHIHPSLIRGVVEILKEACEETQIIITTHNPEVVKTAGLDHILLVSRDEEGYSTITRPRDKREVKIFLKNKIGLDELYVDGLLEAWV
ncbi:MAG: AAA family ATPase [Armatimonadota bacterium]|nr:AAA family ATPase [Armatimonadota bacterium]